MHCISHQGAMKFLFFSAVAVTYHTLKYAKKPKPKTDVMCTGLCLFVCFLTVDSSDIREIKHSRV